MKKEIQNKKEIQLLVDSFYEKVRQDPTLAPVFDRVIQNRWPVHLEKMYKFWGTILLDDKSYRGNPFMPHSELPIEEMHFDIWLKLFHQTLDEHFEGQVAEEANGVPIKWPKCS